MANLLSKMRKTIEKKFDDVIVDLEEPKIWANSGNYVLNHILSGRFSRGYPAGRITQIFGESGSGKSYLVSKAIVEAQKDGYMVVILDSEQAMSHDYLEKIGVDTSPDKLLTVQCYTVEQTQDLMVELLNDVKEARKNNGDKIKLMLIVDSLGLLSSNKAAEDAEKGGSTAADMGTKAKALVRMFNAVTQKIGLTETVCIMTNHGAKEVGVMFPQIKPVGGRSVEYVPSISLRVTKSRLKSSELDELAF
jgi:RecA/RadA recombinase